MSGLQRKAQRVAQQSAALAFDVPQVMATRLLRMAAAGAQPSARDQREFQRMWLEKPLAAFEAAQAMWLQGWQSGQAWTLGLLGAAWRWPGAPRPGPARLQAAALDILQAGMAPVQRRVKGNRRRLGRRRP